MADEVGEGGAAEGAIISAMCWVSRGYAAAVLQEFEPSPEELEQYK